MIEMGKKPFDAVAAYAKISSSSDWRRTDAESCVATRRDIIRELESAYAHGRQAALIALARLDRERG